MSSSHSGEGTPSGGADGGWTPKRLADFFNGISGQFDVDARISALRIFLERVVRDPSSEEALRAELVEIQSLSGIRPQTRLFLTAVGARPRQRHTDTPNPVSGRGRHCRDREHLTTQSAVDHGGGSRNQDMGSCTGGGVSFASQPGEVGRVVDRTARWLKDGGDTHAI